VVIGVVRKYSNKKAPHAEQRDVSHSG
jgi:hypothetical protein